MSRFSHKLQPNFRSPGFVNFIFTCVCVEADRALIRWRSHGGSVSVPPMRVPMRFLLPGFPPSSAAGSGVTECRCQIAVFFFLQLNPKPPALPSPPQCWKTSVKWTEWIKQAVFLAAVKAWYQAGREDESAEIDRAIIWLISIRI